MDTQDYTCPNCNGKNGLHSGMDECPPDPEWIRKSEESSIPVTTNVDLEGGIFNMVIALVHYNLGHGWTKEQACEKAANYLESIADGLRQQ